MTDPSAASPSFSAVTLERREDIAILQLSRPAKRNAINSEMLAAIRSFFQELPDDVKGVVVAGVGEHFSAGLDLSELSDKDATEGVTYSAEWHRALEQVQFARVPVVVVLHGAVIGAGLELASAAHIRVAEASAFYALPEGQRGIFLGGGGAVRLTRLLGVARVTDLMMTGRILNAQDGYTFGLSQYLVEKGAGLAKGVEICRRAAANAQWSNFAIIQALPRIAEMGPAEGFLTEALLTGVVQSSREAKSRLSAFLEKRADKIVRPV